MKVFKDIVSATCFVVLLAGLGLFVGIAQDSQGDIVVALTQDGTYLIAATLMVVISIIIILATMPPEFKPPSGDSRHKEEGKVPKSRESNSFRGIGPGMDPEKYENPKKGSDDDFDN